MKPTLTDRVLGYMLLTFAFISLLAGLESLVYGITHGTDMTTAALTFTVLVNGSWHLIAALYLLGKFE